MANDGIKGAKTAKPGFWRIIHWTPYDVTFAVRTQKRSRHRFSIPQAVCDYLGISEKSEVHLRIESLDHEASYEGPFQMRSGMEVVDSKLKKIKPGEWIVVVASRP